MREDGRGNENDIDTMWCGCICEGEGLVGLGASMLNKGKRELRSL